MITDDKTGCWSSVGRVGGSQALNLQSSCLKKIGTCIHELLHALGFYHEQNRNDRDDYVKINRENIPRSQYYNFIKMSSNSIQTFGVEYDYESVLHYSPYAFTSNGEKTIESLRDPVYNKLMGQRVKMSPKDIEKLNKMYCKK